MDILSNEIDLECTNCGNSVNVTLLDFKNNNSIKCHCGQLIKLEEDKVGSIKKLEKSINEFERSMKKLGFQ